MRGEKACVEHRPVRSPACLPARRSAPYGALVPRRGRAARRLRGSLAVALALAACAAHAGDVGAVHGVVHDAQHRPVAAAQLRLKSANSAWSRSGQTDAAGEFAFPAVPVGDYLLQVAQPGFATSILPLTVVSGPAPSTHLQLSAGAPTETVTISAASAPPTADSFTPTTLVDRQDIARTPGADRTNSLAMISDFMPGAYFVHDQLHVRGGHQTSWQIDGVEIPNTNIASNLGPQVDPKNIDYLEAQGGSYPADEGDRTYGVFNVVPRTGFERNNQGELIVSGGNFGQSNDELSLGGHTDNFAYYGSVNGNRSDLGLMTPVASIIHDAEDGYGAFATLIYNATPDDQLRAVASARHDDYQIPNMPGALAQDVQREADAFTILSWVHTFSSQVLLRSSLLYHYNRADYDGDPQDFPVSTTYQHASSYYGAQEALTVSFGRHQLAAGVLGFGQADNQFFHVLFNDGSNPPLRQTLRPAGNLEAAYFQDTCTATSWLTLSAGLRQTHFDGLIVENATDPRLGATVKLPGLEWLLRGFWGKYYQAPPLETLSGPLLEYAQTSDLAFLPLRGERDNEWQLGVTVPLGGWSIAVDHFRTRAQNFFDHNPIGNSDVFLPITITAALISATELSVRSPRFWSAARVHLAYSNQSADGSGTITGGLTNFAPPAGAYALDHDQRNTLNAGFDVELPWQSFAATNLYYGSGFSNGAAPPSHLPSHASLDVSLGRNFSSDLVAAVTVLNVSNRHLLIDNSLTFDGFHWNNPREIYAELRYRFSY
jgi:TonB-dependent receptor-like protein/carboxypeptidase family protein